MSVSESQMQFLSKAETLARLRDQLPTVEVPQLFYFSVREWEREPDAVISAIAERFDNRVVVRSSARGEDAAESSKAGYYQSVLDVPVDRVDIVRGAIERVIASYARDGAIQPDDLVLVQQQVLDVRFAGVLFTRAIGTNAPYYVINYAENATDTVTAGGRARLKVVARHSETLEPEPWQTLLAAVRHIEAMCPGVPLDIEFAITGAGESKILQVRPLAANRNVPPLDDAAFADALRDWAARFRRYMSGAPHLFGRRTMFSDMTDWNPSEMIGDRPNTLAYSLYRYVITDEIWHRARTELGYFDASPGQLMVSFGKKPYIDVRLSFNSLTPADLDEGVREKLVEHCLDKLEQQPELHDKVEHEILFTCYEFDLEGRYDELRAAGFARADLEELTRSLHGLTNSILEDADQIFGRAIESVNTLTARRQRVIAAMPSDPNPWDHFTAAHVLLSDCRYYGTLPFSIAARLAFIAKQLLAGLDRNVAPGITESFFAGLYTVASRFRDDMTALTAGELTSSAFLARYGHLRPGSYDITAPTYQQMPELLRSQAGDVVAREHRPFVIDGGTADAIDALMREHRLFGDHEVLFSFMSRAMRYRESLKFEFTKNLSAAIEHLKAGGTALGFDIDDLSMLKVTDFWRLRNPETSEIARAEKMLREAIDHNRETRKRAEPFLLPPLICREGDFFSFEVSEAKPNFVGDACVQGPVVVLPTGNNGAHDLTGRIILVESADPGYDWLFAHGIAALVTKYGGVTSHMAIRCSELGVPGVIGCGELWFDKLKRAPFARIDCSCRSLEIMDA